MSELTEERRVKWRKRGSKKCPVIGCETQVMNEDGLFAHLTNYHRKNELVATIIEMSMLFVLIPKTRLLSGEDQP